MIGAPNMKYLRLEARRKEIPWKLLDLPRKLKDQCIAYCTQEGGIYQVGRPTKNAIIFVFSDGTVYDISLLLHAGFCWRKVDPSGLKWIKEHTP